MAAERLVIAGEVYSTNLGDGVIHETLAYLFRSQDPSLQIKGLDISGRPGWGETPLQSGWKTKTIKIGKVRLGAVYSLANALRLLALIRTRHSNQWKTLLENSATMVIGGGQLLMDNHLDFPVKLYELRRIANQYHIPIHITACGVKAGWSPAATILLRKVLLEARSITVRDPASQHSLGSLVPEISCTLTFDPAIYAADVYGSGNGEGQTLIGLGVISLLDVNLHRPRPSLISETDWMNTWLGIIQALEATQLRCQIFTNGSPADEEFARKLQTKAQNISSGLLPLAQRPILPRQLAHQISRYSGIIAARLHASLIAASYHIPAVGLSWETKVASFFNEIGRPENLFPLDGFDPQDLAERLSISIQQGVTSMAIENCRAKALRNVTAVMR